jgi:hypothetical protein
LSLLAGWEGGEEFGIKNATLDDFKIILLFVQRTKLLSTTVCTSTRTGTVRTVDRFCSSLS